MVETADGRLVMPLYAVRQNFALTSHEMQTAETSSARQLNTDDIVSSLKPQTGL